MLRNHSAILLAVLCLGVAVPAAGESGSPESWDKAQARFGCEKGEAKPACVERLRAALRRELAAPKQTRVGIGRCEKEEHNPCSVVFDGCSTRAQLYLSALQDLGPDAAPAAPEAAQAVRLGGQLEELALRVLVEARAPEAVGLIDKRLDSDDVDCRWSAFRGAQTLGSAAQALMPHLERLALEGDWHDREDLVKALVAVGGPSSVGALRKVLVQPPLKAQAAALNALSTLGGSAKEAAPELEVLSQRHWSPALRCQSAKVVTTVAGKKVSPAACAGPKVAFQGDDVLLPGGERVSLEPLQHSRFHGKAKGPCAGADLKWASFALVRGDACLVGIDAGEWGGALVEYRGGKRRELRKVWYLNPLRVVEAHGRLFVLEGMDHIMRQPGAVTELIPGPGGFRAEPFLDPGMPLRAAGLTASGDLLLRGEPHLPLDATACPETAACGGSFLLRVDARGEVTGVP